MVSTTMIRIAITSATMIASTVAHPNLPALSWLQANQDVDAWFSSVPPSTPMEGRLTHKMCNDHVLPQSFIFDHIDWFTFGEKRGEWLARYGAPNDHGICWGEGKHAEKWFEDTMAGKNCGRPFMVFGEEDVPVSRWQQQFTAAESPAVMGLDPSIIKFCRDLEGDSRVVPDLNDPFWFTWESSGMPKPTQMIGPMSIIESNLLEACTAANRNILRVSAMAQRKTMWDMCANVEWVVCAAKGKLTNQGNKIEFANPPGVLDGNDIDIYRAYRDFLLRTSAHYEVDMLALTYYMNEICWLSLLCDNADELWSLKRGDQWACQQSEEGDARLTNALLGAHRKRNKRVKETRFVKSSHSVGGHMSGGHMSGGHMSGGHMSGGHVGIINSTNTTTDNTTETSTRVVAADDPLVGSIEATLTINRDFDAITADNTTRAAFEAEFKNDVATRLSIAASRVEVLAISRGSAVVDFRVLRDSSSGDVVSATEMQSAFPAGVIVAGATVMEPVSNIVVVTSAATAPAPPDPIPAAKGDDDDNKTWLFIVLLFAALFAIILILIVINFVCNKDKSNDANETPAGFIQAP